MTIWWHFIYWWHDIMKPLRLYFLITADNNCLFYSNAELVILSEKALSCQ